MNKLEDIGIFVIIMWTTFDLTFKNGYKKEVIPYSGGSMRTLDVLE